MTVGSCDLSRKMSSYIKLHMRNLERGEEGRERTVSESVCRMRHSEPNENKVSITAVTALHTTHRPKLNESLSSVSHLIEQKFSSTRKQIE